MTPEELISQLRQLLASGRTIVVEFVRFPGPPSMGGDGRLRAMTPIPASIFINSGGVIRIERPGQAPEFSSAELVPLMNRFLADRNMQRIYYLDKDDFKVLVALHSDIEPGGVAVKEKRVSAAEPAKKKPCPCGPSVEMIVFLMIVFIAGAALIYWGFSG